MKVTREDFSEDIMMIIITVAGALFLTCIMAGDREFMASLTLVDFCVFFLPVIYLYILAFYAWVANFREIKIDAEGVCVCFGKYEKKYCWEELKEKQLARVKWYAYKEVVILSRRKTHRPKWCDPMYYNTVCRPFSYIVIHLEDETSGKRSAIYKIDKKEFLENLEKWGVKLEDGGYVRFHGRTVIK